MYAIVDVKDKQFKVREDDTLYVPYHSDADVDQRLTLDRVLLLSNEDGDVTLGTPTVDDATVTARVVDHVKGDKVIVFKKKRRKRYRVKRGHRQQYTQIQIESLNADGEAPPPAEPAEQESEPADEADVAPSEDAAVTDADSSTEAPASDEAPDDPETADAEPDEVAPADETSSDDAPDSTASADTDEADTAEDDAGDTDTAEPADEDESDSVSEDNPFDQDTSFSDDNPFADDDESASDDKDEQKSGGSSA
jgi:large subunit ribosomal protein L21